MAEPNPEINNHPIMRLYEVHEGATWITQQHIKEISRDEKKVLLQRYIPILESIPEIKDWKLHYTDCYKHKLFYSSKGSALEFDSQICGIRVIYNLEVDGKPFRNGWSKGSQDFTEIQPLVEEMQTFIEKDIDYVKKAVPVTPGKYTVVFSPMATGIFAHESFGHKSESDLMIGSESALNEWALGKRVGSSILSIIDRGDLFGNGYVPYDDEGTKCKVNHIIKDGILTGRLHNGSTAAAFQEELTGNARAMNFEYEPLVRMTTTYIDKGNLTKEELIGAVQDGIYIEDVKHGSGSSTFTLAPSRAYRIREGKISEPVMISVVTGNVMDTLYEIDGVSDEIELLSFVGGGCGKLEQFPLPVGFGGPYIRVNNIEVQ